MFARSRCAALSRAVEAATATASAPAFPASCIAAAARRAFSASAPQASKLGRTPISVPPGVELVIGEPIVKKDPTTYLKIPRRTVQIAGPLGKLEYVLPPFLHMDYDTEARRITLSIDDRDAKEQRQMWGTTWAYLSRHIIGVSEGHTALLRLVGIGYRATIEERPDKEEYPGQKFVILKLGFNHTVDMGVPKGISASTPQPTRVLLEGINREELMSFAATIKRWRKPEPYKGKGIFVNDETIRLKQKKIK